VQVLRTYPDKHPRLPFAPRGERSIARAYGKAIARARRLIYIEDQYLWSADIGRRIAAALRAHPGLHVVAVLPHHPDQDGAVSLPPNLLGRYLSLSRIQAAAPGRVGVFGVENHAGTPVYVHAKVCIVDDRWASVGSDNLNRRSWTHDSELSAAVWDTTPTDDGHSSYARTLRQELASEHLDRPTTATDAATVFAEFTRSAAALQAWRDSRTGPRPPGRLRPLMDPPLSAAARAWSTPLYRVVYDPDARRPLDRLRRRY
jgi:phosphatidylserine/phosphatidylglycerophosphate/cardiolipin synthase-like enzyme